MKNGQTYFNQKCRRHRQTSCFYTSFVLILSNCWTCGAFWKLIRHAKLHIVTCWDKNKILTVENNFSFIAFCIISNFPLTALGLFNKIMFFYIVPFLCLRLLLVYFFYHHLSVYFSFFPAPTGWDTKWKDRLMDACSAYKKYSLPLMFYLFITSINQT